MVSPESSLTLLKKNLKGGLFDNFPCLRIHIFLFLNSFIPFLNSRDHACLQAINLFLAVHILN